jgi:hypothetical protein
VLLAGYKAKFGPANFSGSAEVFRCRAIRGNTFHGDAYMHSLFDCNPDRTNHPNWRPRNIVGAFVIALLSSFDTQAQSKDDLWEVTMKMEMAGAPMQMPAQTMRVCTAKNSKDEDYIPRRDNCKMLEGSRAGNKYTYKMACTGDPAMNVSGETTYGSNSYEGRMVMTGQSGGQPMSMTQTFSGKRVGDCTAPAK